MMSWLGKLFEPEQMQYKDYSLEEIQAALQNHEVQKRWLDSILTKIQQMNMEVDNLLAKEDKARVWETFAIERRTLLACLRMITDAKDSIETDRFEQEAQNKLFTRYQGASAALDTSRKTEG